VVAEIFSLNKSQLNFVEMTKLALSVLGQARIVLSICRGHVYSAKTTNGFKHDGGYSLGPSSLTISY